MPELFDLDAAKAAQREKEGEPFEFAFAGEKFAIPPSDEWPLDISSLLAAGEVRAALVEVMSIVDPDAPERFFALHPTMGHLRLVFDEAAKQEGIPDLPNSPPPRRPGSRRT